MADQFSKETRSRIMSKIKSKNTAIEICFRKLLWKNGLKGFRANYDLPGKPDIVFASKKIAIFLDGDFWHGYNWKKLGKIPPKTYWQSKIQRNINRDKLTTKTLKKNGWKVIRLWEHEINQDPQKCVDKILTLNTK